MYKLELIDHESESTAFTTTGASVAECAAELMLAIQDHAGNDAAEYLPVISEGLQMLFSAFVEAEGPCRISNPEMSGEGFDLILSYCKAEQKVDDYPLTPAQKRLVKESPYTWAGGSWFEFGGFCDRTALWEISRGNDAAAWSCYQLNPLADHTRTYEEVCRNFRRKHADVIAAQ